MDEKELLKKEVGERLEAAEAARADGGNVDPEVEETAELREVTQDPDVDLASASMDELKEANDRLRAKHTASPY